MKKIDVKDLMVPLKDYATVPLDATLLEAILVLDKTQKEFDPSKYKHRAILVLDENGKVVSKLTMKKILVALEPTYGKVDGMEVLERSGYSSDLIQSMFKDQSLWTEPLQFFRDRAMQLTMKDLIEPPPEDNYIEKDATLGEAIHKLIVYSFHSLLVTSDDEIVGILRFSDVFAQVCKNVRGE